MQTKKLADALTLVGRFILPRSPLDKFRMVWIREVNGGTTVSTSTSIGAIEVFIDEPCEANACVQHAIMSGVIRSIKQEEVALAVNGPHLDIFTATGKLSIPDHELAAPDIDVAAEVGICASSAEMRSCSKKLRSLADSSELRLSHGQRLYVDEGLLRWVGSNRRAWGCTWCECGGGEMDVTIPNNTILAAVECMVGEVSSLSLMPTGVSVVSDDITMLLPTEAQGTAHRPYSNAAKAWEAAHVWNVGREPLREFLGQVSVLSRPEAMGFWMVPTVDGLLCRYTGRADGTNAKDLSVDGYCECIIEGECDGEPIYISSGLVSDAVDCASDDNFVLRATHQGLFVLSDNLAWGVGAMQPPQEVGA